MILTAEQKTEQVRHTIAGLEHEIWSEGDNKKINMFVDIMAQVDNSVCIAIHRAQIILNGAEFEIDKWTTENNLSSIQRLMIEEKLVLDLSESIKDYENIRDAYGTVRGLSREGHKLFRKKYLDIKTA